MAPPIKCDEGEDIARPLYRTSDKHVTGRYIKIAIQKTKSTEVDDV